MIRFTQIKTTCDSCGKQIILDIDITSNFHPQAATRLKKEKWQVIKAPPDFSYLNYKVYCDKCKENIIEIKKKKIEYGYYLPENHHRFDKSPSTHWKKPALKTDDEENTYND